MIGLELDHLRIGLLGLATATEVDRLRADVIVDGAHSPGSAVSFWLPFAPRASGPRSASHGAAAPGGRITS